MRIGLSFVPIAVAIEWYFLTILPQISRIVGVGMDLVLVTKESIKPVVLWHPCFTNDAIISLRKTHYFPPCLVLVKMR